MKNICQQLIDNLSVICYHYVIDTAIIACFIIKVNMLLFETCMFQRII